MESQRRIVNGDFILGRFAGSFVNFFYMDRFKGFFHHISSWSWFVITTISIVWRLVFII